MDWRSKREFFIKKTNNHEISLSDIYKDSGFPLLSDYDTSYLIEQEQLIESSQLIANKEVQSIITKKREEGFLICFISDMYLDSGFLKKILLREGCALEHDQVFVSCEYDKRKSNGELYKIVEQYYHPVLWEHYGDNRHSDYEIAKKLGIKAHLISTGLTEAESFLHRYESLLRDKGLFKILIHTSRAGRLLNRDTPTSRLAADFIAPVYISYVLFIINSAKREGIKRLYFLARDGYILYRLARILSLDKDLDIRYLYVSRRSLTPPFIAEYPDETSYLKTQWGETIARNISIESLLTDHFLTTAEELKHKYKITFPYEKIVSKNEEKDFLKKMFHSDYTEELLRRVGAQNKLLIDYFLQEGLFDDIKTAMVDVGWLGSSRYIINKLLKTKGKSTKFYYFGAEKNMRSQTDGEYVVFNSSGEYPIPLIENYYSAAPHESTIGYRIDELSNRIVPVFPNTQSRNDYSLALENIKVVEDVATLVSSLQPIPDSMLYLWMLESLNILSYYTVPVDLTPLLSLSPHSSKAFIKKLNIKEFLQVFLWDKYVSDFNKGSLQITVPPFVFKYLYPLQREIALLHHKIYRHIHK